MSRLRIAVLIPLASDVLDRLSSRYDVIALAGQPDSASTKDLRDVAVIVTNGSTGASAQTMSMLPELGLICVYGAGYEAVDIEAAQHRGVRVAHAPGLNDATVADHAMALMLALARGICPSSAALRLGGWEGLRGARPTLTNARLGILGFGNIGQAIARRAAGFDMQISYCTRNERPGLGFRHFSSAQDLATQCDFLVAACPGGAATRHLVNAAVLEALGPDGFLVNIARGSVVDTKALIAALNCGGIAGAGLDVWEGEPDLPADLRHHPAVLLTPHMAGRSPLSQEAQIVHLLDNLRRFETGMPIVAQLA